MLILRKTAAFILLSLMFFCVTKNSVLLVFYKVNTSLFVSLLCENKSRPELKCNGHCKLAQMAKEQDKEDGANALIHLQQEIFLYYMEPENLLKGQHFNDTTTKAFALYTNSRYSFLFLSRNDKPPEFLS